MLARRLLCRGLPQARAAVARLPAPAAAEQKRWGSTNFPATSFLDPPRDVEADVQRVGPHGPLRNLDVKESTVELSTACECEIRRPAISSQPAAHSRRAGSPACPRWAAECSASQRGWQERADPFADFVRSWVRGRVHAESPRRSLGF